MYHVTRVLEENNLVNLQLSYQFLNNLVSKMISNTEIRTQERQIEKTIEHFAKAAPAQVPHAAPVAAQSTVSLVHTAEKEIKTHTQTVLERAAAAQKQAQQNIQAYFTAQNTLVTQPAQHTFVQQQNEVSQHIQQTQLQNVQQIERVLQQVKLSQAHTTVQQTSLHQSTHAAPLSARSVSHQYRTTLDYLLHTQQTQHVSVTQQTASASRPPARPLPQLRFVHDEGQIKTVQQNNLSVENALNAQHLTQNSTTVHAQMVQSTPPVPPVTQQHLTQNSTTVQQQTVQSTSPVPPVTQQHLTQNSTTVNNQTVQDAPAVPSVTQRHLTQNSTTVNNQTVQGAPAVIPVTQQHLTQNNTTVNAQTVQNAPPVMPVTQQHLTQNSTTVNTQTVQDAPVVTPVTQQHLTQNSTTVHQQTVQDAPLVTPVTQQHLTQNSTTVNVQPLQSAPFVLPAAQQHLTQNDITVNQQRVQNILPVQARVQPAARQMRSQQIQAISLIQPQQMLQHNHAQYHSALIQQTIAGQAQATPRTAPEGAQMLQQSVVEPLLYRMPSEEAPAQPSFLSVPLVHEQPKEVSVVQEEGTDLLEIIQKTNKIEQTQIENQVYHKKLQIQETISDVPQGASFSTAQATQWVQPNSEQVAKIADKVYKVIEQRLRTEKSRRGMR